MPKIQILSPGKFPTAATRTGYFNRQRRIAQLSPMAREVAAKWIARYAPKTPKEG